MQKFIYDSRKSKSIHRISIKKFFIMTIASKKSIILVVKLFSNFFFYQMIWCAIESNYIRYSV